MIRLANAMVLIKFRGGRGDEGSKAASVQYAEASDFKDSMNNDFVRFSWGDAVQTEWIAVFRQST